MEDMYMLEFFVKNIKLQCSSGKLGKTGKKLTVNVDFGKFASLIINETEFDKDSEDVPEEEVETVLMITEEPTESNIAIYESDFKEDVDEKIFDSGSSLIFALNPDGLKQTFRLFPLEISVWTNDDTERRACVGVTKILWDTEFFNLASECSKTCGTLPPATVKTVQNLTSEVSGSVIGEITSLIRLTCLGKKVVTIFKEAVSGNGFIFRNRTGNFSHRCRKYGIRTSPEDLSTVGIIYESCEMEDPDIVKANQRKEQVAQELKAAGLDEGCVMFITGNQRQLRDAERAMPVPLPCGNANCKLTKMIQSYLTQDETLKLNRDPGSCDPGRGGGQKKGDTGTCCGCNDAGEVEQPACGASQAEQPKFVICEVCGGYSNTLTCKDTQGREPCAGPCYLSAGKPDGSGGCCKGPAAPKPPAAGSCSRASGTNVERLLFEGLTKMLSSSKVTSQACVSKPVDTCPKEGRCCRR